jgi:glycosyltransferase involved in cell wall biosynthesis
MRFKKSIKILFCYEKNAGGETVAIESICRQLAKNKSFTTAKCSVDKLSKTDFFSYFYWMLSSIIIFSAKVYSEKEISLIYTTTFTAALTIKPFAFFSNKQLIFHYHGNRIPEKPTHVRNLRAFLQQIKYFVSRRLQKYAFTQSKLIIVPSDETASELQNVYNLPGSKFRVISNGYDPSLFFIASTKQKNQFRAHLGIDRKNKVLLISGRIDPHKNLLKALVISKFLQFEVPHHLLFAFPPAQDLREQRHLTTLKEATKRLAVNAVFIEDAYSKYPPSAIIGSADIVVSLSKKEFFPLSFLEALACGTPYITTTPNIVALINQFDPCLFIESEEINHIVQHIQKIFTPEYQRRFARNRLKFISEFTWHKVVQLLELELKSSVTRFQ